MATYRVKLNGETYEVEVEKIDASEVKTVQEAPKAASEGGEAVKAPMPGNILSVNVQNGKAVKKGEVLFILEALKMENEILAPCDGTVSAVSVQKGQTVETGVLLCTIA